MEVLDLILLILHIASGTGAVFVGLGALLTRKGGRRHRRSGTAFTACMFGVIVTATALTVLHPDAYFAGLTSSAGMLAFSGYRVLGRKRPDLDPAQRARVLDWAAAATCGAVGLYVLYYALSGAPLKNPAVTYAVGVASVVYAAYDLARFARPMAFPFSQNLWLYEHIAKMVGAYFSAMAAFSGNLLTMLPDPFRQLWATTLGQVLIVVLIVYYRRKLNRRPSEPQVEISIGVPAHELA